MVSTVKFFGYLCCLVFGPSMYFAQNASFPDHFAFGVGTAAHQIEGGWNADGKGENVWDRYCHTDPRLVKDGINGDVAADSYHLYERDLEMLSELGVDFYKFSISWSRILPTGYINQTNKVGIQYYNNIINGLVAKNIRPIVIMCHWDQPQPMQDLGGFANPLVGDYFMDYAELLLQLYGDRVKDWITFNEPFLMSMFPTIISSANTGVSNYLCAHNILKTHARVYHLYDDVYRKHQHGKISICLDTFWYEPETDAPEDLEAVERHQQFHFGWFAHPIYSASGDYPPIMREIVDRKSKEQGFRRSRLPYFTKDEVEYIKGTSDFFSLNHYTTKVVYGTRPGPVFSVPSFNDDAGISEYQPDSFPASADDVFRTVPWGFRRLLNYVKNTYNNPTVIITESGYPTDETHPDQNRIAYISSYLREMLNAINIDGCDVQGYSVWSLMDSFEWSFGGYRNKFGLYHTDFESPVKTRTLRASGKYYADVISRRALPDSNECY